MGAVAVGHFFGGDDPTGSAAPIEAPSHSSGRYKAPHRSLISLSALSQATLLQKNCRWSTRSDGGPSQAPPCLCHHEASSATSAILCENVRDWDEYSKAETSGPSDSDRESDYMTGQEDFVEGTTKTSKGLKAEDMLVHLNDPSQTSSFIQNILYEDSCAGVAVVDLFVAVKAVKDKMDFLTKCNNDVLCKITALNKETIAIRAGYNSLLASMLQFLDRINAFSPPSSHPEEQLKRSNGSICDNPCRCCGSSFAPGAEEEARGPKSCCQHRKNIEYLRSLLSVFGDKARTPPPILNEALLGSLIASLLWLQKGEGEFRGSSQRQATPKTSEKSFDLTESNIQMVCDICAILCGAPPQGLQPLNSAKPQDPPEEPHGSTRPSRPLDRRTGARGRQTSTDSSGSKDDTASEGESVFEEALTEPPMPSGACHNVTCMGDLFREGSGKKNVSTFTASNDTAASWVGKLTDDIKAKLRRIKSKTNVTVLDGPCNKLSGAVEFSITANTPLGVFDVTVLQYRKRRQSKRYRQGRDSELPLCGSSFPAPVSDEGSNERRLALGTTDVRDDDFFLDDQDNSRYDSAEGSSDAGDDDMEEFLEIYLENSNDRKAAPRQQATSSTIVFKLPKWPFFEIRKRYPALFVLQLTPKRATAALDQQIVPLNAGGRQQREVVIRRSASDLVIYIQVEVEDGKRSAGGGLSVEYQRSSHGTQTRDAPEEKVIKLGDDQQDGESLFHVWRGYETGSLGEADERERITFEEPVMVFGDQEEEKDDEREVTVKEPKGKAVTFSEVAQEILIEREVRGIYPEEDEEEERWGSWGRGSATVVAMMNAKLRADVWFVQRESMQRLEAMRPQWRRRWPRTVGSVELEKALNLVREIESDVVDVKLSDAISILPLLESELRKHLHTKMRSIGEADPERGCSVENFFSAVDFWPDEGPLLPDGGASEERLNNLLKLLSDLEEAVRSNGYFAPCENTSSKIYKLLHALTDSIRRLEDSPDVTSLSRTLDIASQLDTAVREYDSEMRKQPLERVEKEEEEEAGQGAGAVEEVLGDRHLKGVRKKVFEMVEEEAIEMEGRIERDFDRLDRLEGENEEAMKFLEAFLQKTERRAAELDHLKADLQELTSSMGDMYERTLRARLDKDNQPPKGPHRPTGNQPVRETISGLLIALDSLKSRAREKNQLCREILSSAGFQTPDSSSRRSSRSSFTAKQVETMTSTIKDFRKIGQTSLYLSWSKPEGSPSVCVMGYEIHVNGTLNQKVRNPGRLQAVLYSVDLTKEAEVNLYAVVDTGPKILLATVAYLDGEQPDQ